MFLFILFLYKYICLLWSHQYKDSNEEQRFIFIYGFLICSFLYMQLHLLHEIHLLSVPGSTFSKHPHSALCTWDMSCVRPSRLCLRPCRVPPSGSPAMQSPSSHMDSVHLQNTVVHHKCAEVSPFPASWLPICQISWSSQVEVSILCDSWSEVVPLINPGHRVSWRFSWAGQCWGYLVFIFAYDSVILKPR